MTNQNFGLIFKSHPENCVEQMKDHHVILLDDSERGWKNANGEPTHILIEGENYQALRALEYTHAGKIDVIEIDSPYNTGNKDFVYNDTFVDKEDPCRHSKWLSFMKNRLHIAHKLLSERGVIFLHIDDNEMAHLKLLCDQIFGEQNFVNNIVWMYENSTMKNPRKSLASIHEYVLVYCKNNNVFEPNKIREDNVSEKLVKRFGKYANENGEILFGKVQNEKSYLERIVPKFVKENGRLPEDNDVIDTLKGNYVRDVINFPGTRSNEFEKRYGVPFNNPKPVELIKRLLSLGSQKDSIILDFFAGSGTTGEAVAELNKEDGGSRQCILITNNEKSDRIPEGIARGCTQPRLKNSVGSSTNLRYLRVETLPHTDKYSSDSAKISQLQVENRMLPILCLKHNTHNAVEKGDKYTIFTNDNGTFFLGVYFNSLEKVSYVFNSDTKELRYMLNAYGKKNDIEINHPTDGYATEYFNFIKSHNQ
jgi:adenine-specific DNA-methyltransferase